MDYDPSFLEMDSKSDSSHSDPGEEAKNSGSSTTKSKQAPMFNMASFVQKSSKAVPGNAKGSGGKEAIKNRSKTFSDSKKQSFNYRKNPASKAEKVDESSSSEDSDDDVSNTQSNNNVSKLA